MAANGESGGEGAGFWSHRLQLPSLAELATAAGYVRVPMIGDVFTTMSRAEWGPVVQEYTDRAPHGRYRGTYQPNTEFVAIGVDRVWLPEYKKGLGWDAIYGIAVEVESQFEEGATSWVNITRGCCNFVNSRLHNWPRYDRGEGKGGYYKPMGKRRPPRLTGGPYDPGTGQGRD